MDESVENTENTISEKSSDDNENPILIKNMENENLKVFSENSSNSNNNPIKESDSSSIGIINDQINESCNSPSSIGVIKNTKSENLSDDNENSVKNENLKVFGENLSNSNEKLDNSSIGVKDDQKNESCNSLSSVGVIKDIKSDNLSDDYENSIKNGSDENLKVFGENLSNSNEKPIGTNGSDKNLKVFDDNLSNSNEKSGNLGVNDDQNNESCNSPSSVGVVKGKGLRKWKRIKRRDFVKEDSGSVDSTKAIKRGLSTSGNNLNRGLKSEGSLSSTGAVVVRNVKKVENEVNGSVLDQKGEFSDNSSISSTAASGSVLRKVVSEKKGVKGLVKSKKARGEREKIEKENSITSSLESDSRSSNFVFAQGSDHVSNIGDRNVKVGNVVGENSDDEDQNGEKRIDDEVVGGIGDENGDEMGDLAGGEDQNLETELDPLAGSILKLQAAQEALEKELQKLREMGDESQGTLEEDVHEASSSGLFNLQNAEIYPHYLKVHANTPEQNVDVSERKLEEANVVLKEKEAKVINNEDEEIEAEIEDLFRHKLEADFKFLALSRAIENFKLEMVDQVALSDELKTTLNVVRNAENDVNMLRRQADILETRVEETVETEQVSELGKRVRQFTLCLLMQLVLLFLVFVSFDLQSSPHDAGAVPT